VPPVLLRCSGLNEPSHPRQAGFIRTYQSWAKLWSVTVVSNQLRPRGSAVVQARRFERVGYYQHRPRAVPWCRRGDCVRLATGWKKLTWKEIVISSDAAQRKC